MACRDCGKTPAKSPRGLCWVCYRTPSVRARYPISAKYGRKTWPKYTALPPAEPTQAIPGTPEKIEVLQSRASQGVELHHEWDATFADMAKSIPD